MVRFPIRQRFRHYGAPVKKPRSWLLDVALVTLILMPLIVALALAAHLQP